MNLQNDQETSEKPTLVKLKGVIQNTYLSGVWAMHNNYIYCNHVNTLKNNIH